MQVSRSHSSWQRGALVLLACVALVSCASPRLGERTEDFSRNPRWKGSRNRMKEAHPVHVKQNFGWSATNHAGGKPGEIGGRIFRSVRPAYYAKPLKPLTFDDAFSCSGTIAVTEWNYTYGWQSGSSVYFGFFNSKDQNWRPPSFMGFRVEAINDKFKIDDVLTWEKIGLDPKNPPKQSPRPSNPLVYVVNPVMLEFTYGTAAWVASGPAGSSRPRDESKQAQPEIFADGKPHTWAISYDPKGEDGKGEITVSWDGEVVVQGYIAPEHRRQGATMDRFGIFNYQQSGDSMDAWFDDITVNGQHHDFTTDPGWEGKGNRDEFLDHVQYGINDFGYSKTNHAGAAPGEVGGRFWRVDKSEKESQGNYGADLGRLTFDDKFMARGKISVPRFSIDSGMHIGFYNSRQQGWPPKNFVGVYFDSLTDTGRLFAPMYGTSQAMIVKRKGEMKNVGVGGGILFPPDGRPRDFSITYDPDANGGNGAMTLTLDKESRTVNFEPGHKAQGAVIDRFGMFNMQDDNGKECLIYLDDLTYTTRKGARKK